MNRPVSTLLALAIPFVLGCTRFAPEPDLAVILSERVEPGPSDAPDPLEFDFGSVLARDQTLRHEFRLANRSDKPLGLLGSRANVPCCSGMGKLPDSIAPGGEVIVPVTLNAGHVAERKRVSFEIKTDSPSRAIRTLVLIARLVPNWEVEEAPGDPGPVKIGQASKKLYRVLGRRKAGEGLRAPTEIVASGDVEIEAAPLPSEVERSDGLIESLREVVVRLPAQYRPGEKIGSLTFRWPDGSSRVHEVRWSVRPSLQLSPPVLVLKPAPVMNASTVDVRSDARPFRVLKVSGNLVNGDVPPSAQASKTQSLRIPLDLSRVVPGVKPEIEIVTDHPDEPKLTLGVLVLPAEKRGSE